MDENRLRFGVGVLVVAAVAVAIILTFLFGAFPTMLSNDLQLTAVFDSAPGVSSNTRVLRDGVKVGRVSSIKLLPEGGVQITMEIERRYAPTPAYVPRISMGSFVTGDANLEFVRRSEDELVELLDGQAGNPPDGQLDPEERRLISLQAGDGDFIGEGKVANDPFAVMVGLEDQVRETLATMNVAGGTIATAGEQVRTLAGQVSQLIDDEGGEVRRLADTSREAADEMTKTLRSIRSFTEDEQIRARLKEAIVQFPEVVQQADSSLEQITEAAQSFDRLGADARDLIAQADGMVGDLRGVTGPLGRDGERFSQLLQSNLENLEQTLVEVGYFTRQLNDSNGTLGRLLKDDELYEQIQRIVTNIERATVRIRPILDDARVISDKLARDPRQLGVRGALERRPSRVGLK